ncbi:MAG TPA: efflux RND transporter periplasmic adaptor subunit [Bryobacteraceae bacterium]|nr:efflux RND transporter periplasmic adaptor subunit [Bryobacteraceae bacterium]
MKRSIRAVIWLAGLGALSAAGWVGAQKYRGTQTADQLPVAQAREGEFLAIIRCRGELRASRSAQIYAPIVPNLRIAWMAANGEVVEKDAPVIRFDSSTAQQDLIRKEAQLTQSQATLDQALAQAQITADHDQGDLTDARFNVEKTRLGTAANEFVGRIQAEQARIDLGVAEQRLKVQDANIALHAASDKSRLASLTRQRDQAKADVELTKRRIAQMEISAPLSGVVVFVSNYNQGPLNAKPFKVGDNVYSGMNLAEIPDMSSLAMDAKVEEIDRGRVAVGKDVQVRVDALPELLIRAKITQISPLAELSNDYPPTRSFRGYAALQNPDPRLRPGMNGGMDIVIDRIPKAISIPAKAVFTRDGKPVVFVAERGTYRPTVVQLLARNPDEVAVSGLKAGAMVALADPEKKEVKK